MSILNDPQGYGPADITDALRQGRNMEYVHRFVIGNETPTGPTEAHDVRCVQAAVLRLFQLIDDGAL